MKALFKIIGVILFLSVICSDIFAGPTIIRDNRITDLSATPVLGRGYSIGTNTFQSTCMKSVVLTEPSYDMKYSFTQIESKGEETRAKTDYKETEKTRRERASRSKSKTWASYSIFSGAKAGGRYSSTKTGMDQSINRISKSTVINGKKWYNHSMLVTINLYSYYASLDEGRSRLSNAAITLLEGKDLPGFFSSCGPYYVRSIGREAVFVSIFTYQSETETRDSSFENQLRTAVSRFSTESKTSWSAKGGYRFFGGGASVSTDKQTKSLSTKDRQEIKRREDFHRKAENYRLTINTSAYGLGKDKKATLISFDMDSFKAAVKDAFLAMQNPRTGKVSSIEVVPWVENTEFQAFVKLEEEEIPAEEEKKAGETETAEKTSIETKEKKIKTKLLYEKKHILNQNAEFFMEVERADRNKMNMYYKARLCRKNIDMNWKNGGSLKEEYAEAYVVNQRGGAPISIKKLDTSLTEEYVQILLKKEKDFMYGAEGDDANKGATECIRQIMKHGIYMKSYRDIPECQPVLEQLGDVQADILENYCMPEIEQ